MLGPEKIDRRAGMTPRRCDPDPPSPQARKPAHPPYSYTPRANPTNELPAQTIPVQTPHPWIPVRKVKAKRKRTRHCRAPDADPEHAPKSLNPTLRRSGRIPLYVLYSVSSRLRTPTGRVVVRLPWR
ncbi:hypothetical protein LTR28_003891 [Elasticomyces elasticus]|nr:hypothetical protein LTR28_003891 [Elasticomyces elasticus]